MRATAVMLMVALELAAGACTGERATAPNDAAPSVSAEEAAAASEPTKRDTGEGTPTAEPAKTEAPEVAQADEPAATDAAEAAKTAETANAAEPAKTAEPALAGSAAAVVFAAVVRRKRWSVDMTEFEGIDVAALEKELTRALETKGEDAARRELKDGDPRLPAGFGVGDPWTLVTRKGAEHRTAESFAAQLMGGSGKLHLYVRLGAVTGKLKGPALALRGHLPLTTTLAVPEPLAKSAIDSGLRKRIDKALAKPVARELKEEPDEFRRLVQAIPIRAKDVKAYPGRFPGDRTHVVFLQTGPAAEDNGTAISAVLLMKADGTVEHHRLAGVWGSVSLLGLLDVDGDGLDEVFYEDAYHEGWSLEMLHWEGDEPRSRTLSGDGL